MLDGPISKQSIEAIVQEVCTSPKYLEDIYRLIDDEKQTVSWRAIWACEKLSEIHPQCFVPLQEEFIGRLLKCKHDGFKRLLLSISYNMPVLLPIPIDY